MSISGNVRALTLITIAVSLHLTENADARYRYHHRQHHHRDIIYTPDRSTATVRNEWPYVQEEIIYPLASGTTVLDTYSGREPVISPFDCGYRGVDWYRMRHDWAYMANNLR